MVSLSEIGNILFSKRDLVLVPAQHGNTHNLFYSTGWLSSSTLAKLMIEKDLDLSTDDVHSWLEALNERGLSKLRMIFLSK